MKVNVGNPSLTPKQLADIEQQIDPYAEFRGGIIYDNKGMRYGNDYGSDMPTGQPYYDTPSPYANVTPNVAPKVAPPPQQARNPRPEQRPSAPSPQSVPTGVGGSKLGQVPENQAGGDPLSPTTLIYNYLREKGMPLTSENVRRVLESNAQNPGIIPGTGRDDAYSNAEMPVHLVNDVAGVDPKAAPGQRRLPMPPTPPKLGDEQGPPYTPPVGVSSDPILDIAKRVLGGIPPPGPNSPPPQWPSGPPSPSPVGQPPVPQMNPPTPGAEVALPVDPMEASMQRAMQPRLPGPTAQLALPAPPQAPAPAQLSAPPAPQRPATIAGPPAPLLLEGPKTPNVSVRQLPTPTPQMQAPPISPQAPVEQGPVARGVGNVGAGIASGYARGGPRGAVVGGAGAAAKELIPPLVEAVKRGAATRKAPRKRPTKADKE